jgi:hypothetical protein
MTAECVSCGSWTQYGELCIRCRKQRIAIVVVEHDRLLLPPGSRVNEGKIIER